MHRRVRAEGAQRVAELEERIAVRTGMRDSLVRRIPRLAAPAGPAS